MVYGDDELNFTPEEAAEWMDQAPRRRPQARRPEPPADPFLGFFLVCLLVLAGIIYGIYSFGEYVIHASPQPQQHANTAPPSQVRKTAAAQRPPRTYPTPPTLSLAPTTEPPSLVDDPRQARREILVEYSGKKIVLLRDLLGDVYGHLPPDIELGHNTGPIGIFDRPDGTQMAAIVDGLELPALTLHTIS